MNEDISIEELNALSRDKKIEFFIDLLRPLPGDDEPAILRKSRKHSKRLLYLAFFWLAFFTIEFAQQYNWFVTEAWKHKHVWYYISAQFGVIALFGLQSLFLSYVTIFKRPSKNGILIPFLMAYGFAMFVFTAHVVTGEYNSTYFILSSCAISALTIFFIWISQFEWEDYYIQISQAIYMKNEEQRINQWAQSLYTLDKKDPALVNAWIKHHEKLYALASKDDTNGFGRLLDKNPINEFGKKAKPTKHYKSAI